MNLILSGFVYVKDHAGNETLYETEPFFIDSTPPNISVEWDSDSGEAVNGSIFAESRRARIRIRDKFPDLSGIRISVSGKSIQPEWVEIPGGGEGTIYETKLNFWEDGNYELTIQGKIWRATGRKCAGNRFRLTRSHRNVS